MNDERAALITWMRGEIVGPSKPVREPVTVTFENNVLIDNGQCVRGPKVWQPEPGSKLEEVLLMKGDAPHQKYGVGLLHPDGHPSEEQVDEVSNGISGDDVLPEEDFTVPESMENTSTDYQGTEQVDADDFEVSSTDVRYPSTIGITINIKIDPQGEIVIHFPQEKRFFWQLGNDRPFPVNGRYEQCIHRVPDGKENPSVWRRYPCFNPDTKITVSAYELQNRQVISRDIELPEGSPGNMHLVLKVYPRRISEQDDCWLLTVVLQNTSGSGLQPQHYAATLYQAFFEVTVRAGCFVAYPESSRGFSELDEDEQSLALLYRDSSTWAIGHGCAAGWDAELGNSPSCVYADVMPAVELPSMTPDIVDVDGNMIQLSMRQLSSFTPDFNEADILLRLAEEYYKWIEKQRDALEYLENNDLKIVAKRHIEQSMVCLGRIRKGIELLESNTNALNAFRLANLAMLLQQIAAKKLKRRPLIYDRQMERVRPQGEMQSPWLIYKNNNEGGQIGQWRAFQLAFLLMSIEGVIDGKSPDRDTVDLIWFPTGGGKTEAYLAVVSFYIFYNRLQMADGGDEEHRLDGTNVLMRYTLRMLTAQQFQRAASLIAAMEFLRRLNGAENLPSIPGKRFSIGLWVGKDATPNKISDAANKLVEFRKQRNGHTGNPFVLTECPWCRSEIGRFHNELPRRISKQERVKGINSSKDEGPRLLCPDSCCEFGQMAVDTWLPIEVIDQRIYQTRPSLVIGTADKFAMIAYQPDAGALFGRSREDGVVRQTYSPPGMIIQDELHLISGPLGTMYAMYESVFEKLCTVSANGVSVKPKIISSTATIRGAKDQVKAVFARDSLSLFPSPGWTMGDSFFGTYARDENNRLRSGRLYLGIHANEFNILTAENRVFASALFRSFFIESEKRDPWWTLLVFFNSIRELGGARTLFDSDIRDRMKFLFSREGQGQERRYIGNPEELTGRIDNAAIVSMMDRLSKKYNESARAIVDVCLASNIIEVGVDIDRLSLMGVVGQPKTTAQYIQVTGRVGRRWAESPGLVLMLYNPAKSRDRSHYEHFHSYHKRLYEQVEPTSATPFSGSAITRALPGILISWVRQNIDAENPVDFERFCEALQEVYGFVEERCKSLLDGNDEELARALSKLSQVRDELIQKWNANPQTWQEYPHRIGGEYLMLWPGQYRTVAQNNKGVDVASSMRSVDAMAGLGISSAYFDAEINQQDG
ncbi:MAG: hypothetical protein ISR54_06150 [Chlorobium phaeobacteroides]|uniref:Helicase domain protein n=1 Tax=Chlorobium phaeobacteroides (strain BS1) TaxID=331678 RepID=B3EJE3_CHLPB|nr:hypothetical protein [Chlorobium phaeobacteroides]